MTNAAKIAKIIESETFSRRSFLKKFTASLAGGMIISTEAGCQKPSAVSNSDFQESDEFISSLAAEDKFSGVALIAQNGQILFKKAYGLASKEFNVSNQTDTKFNLASMTKMFTGVAVGQLAEQNKISFNDPVAAYLPDYPQEKASQISIHHLLTHTSGMGSYWKAELLDANPAKFRNIKDYLPLNKDDDLQFKPGERWSYSNAGFMLLGAVIERVSGRNYFDHVKENIFKRAGMNDTDFYELDKITPNLAIGYTKNNRYLNEFSEWTRNTFLLPPKGSPAGGAYSTVEDMLRFDRALRTHKLMGPKFTEIVTTGKFEYRPKVKYAYGFAEETIEGDRIVFHDGGASGISTEFDMYFESGFTIIVLSNYDHPSAQPVVKKLRQKIAPARP